jgi:hypothetical protein
MPRGAFSPADQKIKLLARRVFAHSRASKKVMHIIGKDHLLAHGGHRQGGKYQKQTNDLDNF